MRVNPGLIFMLAVIACAQSVSTTTTTRSADPSSTTVSLRSKLDDIEEQRVIVDRWTHTARYQDLKREWKVLVAQSILAAFEGDIEPGDCNWGTGGWETDYIYDCTTVKYMNEDGLSIERRKDCFERLLVYGCPGSLWDYTKPTFLYWLTDEEIPLRLREYFTEAYDGGLW